MNFKRLVSVIFAGLMAEKTHGMDYLFPAYTNHPKVQKNIGKPSKTSVCLEHSQEDFDFDYEFFPDFKVTLKKNPPLINNKEPDDFDDDFFEYFDIKKNTPKSSKVLGW